MERYSALYGAFKIKGADGKEKDQYIELGRSEELHTFLKSLQIVNPKKAVDDTNRFLTGFVELPDYAAQPWDDKPMLIRYAPIRLGRLAGWSRNEKPFNAISGSSPDNLVGGRDGKYYHTHFISRDLLLKSGSYNYLDQIFGTPLVTWQEKNAYKEVPINYDAPPRKVIPVQRSLDEKLVKTVVAAIYKKKSVILKLEKDCGFKRRAWELLTQIYALFPPILAAEVGFAAYQNPATIRNLIHDTFIRLFLVPHECDVSGLGIADSLVLDLSADLDPQIRGLKISNGLTTAINFWYSASWEERQPVMEQLFADMVNFQDEQSFVEITRGFATDPFLAWLDRNPDRNTITTLKALREKYEEFPICAAMPAMWEKFRAAAPALVKRPCTLAGLVAKLGAQLALAEDRSSDGYKRSMELYIFGQKLLDNHTQLSTQDLKLIGGALELPDDELRAIWESTSQTRDHVSLMVASAVRNRHGKNVDAAVRAETAEEISNLKLLNQTQKEAYVAEIQQKDAAHAAEIQQKDAAYTAAIQQKDAAHAAEIQQKDAAYTAAIQQKDAAHAAEIQQKDTAHAAEIQQKDAAYTAAIQQKDADHLAELQQKEEERVAQVTAEKANTEAVQKQLDDTRVFYNKKIEDMEVAHRTAIVTAVEGEKAKTEAVEKTLAETKTAHAVELEKQKATYTANLQKKENDHTAAVEQLKADFADEMQRRDEDHKAAQAAAVTEAVDTVKAEAAAVIQKKNKKLEERDADIIKLNKMIDSLKRGVPIGKAVKILNKDIPLEVLTAIAGFVLGALIFSVILLMLPRGAHEDAVPTTEPTTVVTEKVTDPTVPATEEQTVPPTTVPVKLDPLIDGAINWDYIDEELSQPLNFTTNGEEASALMSARFAQGYQIPEGYVLEAVENSVSNTDEAAVIVLRKSAAGGSNADDSTAEEDPADLPGTEDTTSVDLLADACMVLETETHCLVVYHASETFETLTGDHSVAAAAGIFELIAAEDDQQVAMTYHLADDAEVDLKTLLDAVITESGWWKDISVSALETAQEDVQITLGTARLPVLTGTVNGETFAVFQYADAPEKAELLVSNLEEDNHKAAAVGTYVIAVVRAENAE